MICSNGRNNTFAIDVEIQARPFIETRFSAEPMSAFNADAMDEEISFNQPNVADTLFLPCVPVQLYVLLILPQETSPSCASKK